MSVAAAGSAPPPPPLSWAYQIRVAYAHGHFRDAVSLFLLMRASAAPRSSVLASLPAALNSCAAHGLRALGASLHGLAIRSGAFGDRFTANALLNIYCKLPDSYLHSSGVISVDGTESATALESVRKVFDEMLERDVVSWNTLVMGCAEEGRHQEALGLVRKPSKRAIERAKRASASVCPHGIFSRKIVHICALKRSCRFEAGGSVRIRRLQNVKKCTIVFPP
ncbi:hypothetical protein SEVIR_5G051602v4 [Setaria viridis]